MIFALFPRSCTVFLAGLAVSASGSLQCQSSRTETRCISITCEALSPLRGLSLSLSLDCLQMFTLIPLGNRNYQICFDGSSPYITLQFQTSSSTAAISASRERHLCTLYAFNKFFITLYSLYRSRPLPACLQSSFYLDYI